MDDRIKPMVETLVADLAASGRDISTPGIDSEEMLEVMAHPKAAVEVLALMKREETSVQEGDAAPDFSLKPLRGYEGAEPVRLSAHFGKRPVALVFGSYT